MNRRFFTALVAIPVLYLAFHFMPEQWHERMGTIETAADEDSSFQSRLTAWEFNYTLATAFPVTGAGFGGTYTSELWKRFAPGERVRAAHSIYFEVLGEHGFVGLTLFLLIAFFTWMNVRYAVRNTRDRPELLWAHTLGRAIELSVVSYLVGGAALSMAYYDVYYSLVAVSVVLRQIVKEASTVPAGTQQGQTVSRRQGALRLPPATARRPSAPILP
jgi:probable O-glycosylation ligase (exosortase A-associated)